MDETQRRLERSSRASGDRMKTVRAAHEHLRSGRFEAALAALGAPLPDEAPASVELSTRALALKGLGRNAEALGVLEGALASGALGELDPVSLLDALEPALAGRVPLGRARSARLLARVPERPELPLDALRRDPDPLVRIGFVKERPTFTRNDQVTRVYGSHGGDFMTGRFIAFDSTLEMRLRTFEPRLFEGIVTALSTLADDAHVVETLELRIAFGDGWGLGGNNHPIDVRGLERAIDALNALDLLPWRVRHCDVRPYDIMEDQSRFARRLGRDLGGHPIGRQTPYDPTAPLLARLLARHPFRGPPCPTSEFAPLLEEARATYTPLGARACEEFDRFVRRERHV